MFGINGKFELDVTHKIDDALKKDAGFLAINPVAVDLTKLALEYKKKPEEVLAIFKKIRKGLLE